MKISLNKKLENIAISQSGKFKSLPSYNLKVKKKSSSLINVTKMWKCGKNNWRKFLLLEIRK